MKLFFKILLGSLCLFFFSQCRKKPKAPDLASWLEKEYPGRFQVLDTAMKDVVRNLSFSVKKSVVAENENPLIQVMLHWDKRVEGLNLTKEIIEAAFRDARREYDDAKTLLQAMQQMGLEDIAISIHNGTALVLIFAEPTPTHRANSLQLIEQGFQKWAKTAEYNINISYLEPKEKGKEFQEIVPLMYWFRSTSLFRSNLIYSTICPMGKPFSAKEADKNWQYNLEGNRFMTSVDQVQAEAENWAKEHINQPITFLEIREYEQSEKSNTMVNIKFPFVYQNNKQPQDSMLLESDGYIIMVYDAEKNTIGEIKMKKE
jgi:hypothetical protein